VIVHLVILFVLPDNFEPIDDEFRVMKISTCYYCNHFFTGNELALMSVLLLLHLYYACVFLVHWLTLSILNTSSVVLYIRRSSVANFVGYFFKLESVPVFVL
jgi:hypothetical protein